MSNEKKVEKNYKYNNAMEEILALIKGRVPLIWVVTHEEGRFIQDFHKEIAKPFNRKVWLWSGWQGLIPYDQRNSIARASGEEEGSNNPQKALERIAAHDNTAAGVKSSTYIMRDFHCVLGEPIPRQIRDMYEYLIGQGKTIIITSPMLAHGQGGQKAGLPPTLEKQIAVVKYELPNFEMIENRISSIVEHIKQKVKNKSIATTIHYKQEEMINFAKALQGLTEVEIDNAISTSLSHLNKIDVNKLINDKKQLIRKSEILEFIDAPVGIEDVGGLDTAKEYLTKYREANTKEAIEFGVEPLKGILLTGIPGCISSHSLIPYNRGKRTGFRNITVENLYKRFNQLDNRYEWDPEIPTYLYSFDGESKLVKNRLIGVIDSGEKECVRVSTQNNFPPLILTPDHPVCTASGEYIPADKLKPGDRILTRGTMKPQFNGGKKLKLCPKRKVIETLKYHPHGSIHIVNGYIYKRTNYARLVVEAHMNSMNTWTLIDILKNDPDKALTLKYLSPKFDVHHIDENTTNDDISNLMVIEHNAHARLHSKVENFNVDYVNEDIVSRIDTVGVVQTYDIQMEYPNNNFIANNIVVHNTGKSLLAKVIGKLWTVPLLRLDVGKVMTGLVGGSEGKMRDVISQAEAMAPCVLWIDEVEKSLSGTKSSNFSDGGTLARVFGTLLTAMQDGMQGVTIVATANDITMLPPEFIRRFNEVFFVDLPGPNERKEIFEIHLRKRGRDFSKFGKHSKTIINKSLDYTGAEIEKAVKDAIAASFHLGKKDVGWQEVVNAIEETKPIAKVMPEKVKKLREKAKGQYRYASSYSEAQSKIRNVKTNSGKKLNVNEALDDIAEIAKTPKEKAKEQTIDISGQDRFGDIASEE